MIADTLTFGLGHLLIGKNKDDDSGRLKRQRSVMLPFDCGHKRPNLKFSPFNAGIIRIQKDELDEASETERDRVERLEDEEDERLEEDDVHNNEEQTLLPKRIIGTATRQRHKYYRHFRALWRKLPTSMQTALAGVRNFINPPLIGMLIGLTIGLIPPFKQAFFSESEKGIFTTWLTSSVNNIGELFPVLQVIVVGVKLSQSLRQMKTGRESGRLPWLPTIWVLSVRLIIWPAISIPLIWTIASKTNVIEPDPFLLFALAIMPAGPPALKLTALADITGSTEEEKMSIAKFLTVAYAFSPVMAFAVVGALRAAESVIGK